MNKEESQRQKHISQFLEEKEHQVSPHTLSAYKRDLKLYSHFLQTHKDISLFHEYLDKKGLSSRSKARIISSVRSYLFFREEQKDKYQIEAKHHRKKLKSVPVKMSLPKFISPTEFQVMLQSAKEKEKHKTARNHITLFLLFGLGCRISEIINLNLQDLSELDMSLRVTGKRQKQRVLPLTEDLWAKLNEYIKNHRPYLIKTQGLKNTNNHAILINNRGKRPSRIDVYRWLSFWSKKAGFLEVKSPHQFRHGFATSLLENGADLRSIQLLLGHSSIQTTEIYTSVQQAHLKKTIKEHHPLSTPYPPHLKK